MVFLNRKSVKLVSIYCSKLCVCILCWTRIVLSLLRSALPLSFTQLHFCFLSSKHLVSRQSKKLRCFSISGGDPLFQNFPNFQSLGSFWKLCPGIERVSHVPSSTAKMESFLFFKVSVFPVMESKWA